MPKTRTLLSIVAIPLLALLIACGGDKKDDSSSSSGDSGSSSSSQSSGSSGDDRASSDSEISLENCKAYSDLEKSATAAFGTTSSGKATLDKGALDKLVKASPKEIRSDMQIIVDTLVGFFEVLDKSGLNDPSKLDPAKMQAAQAELEKASAKMEDKKFTDASARVEAYYAKKCS